MPSPGMQAISKRLAALEQRLGVVLLNRTTRRLALTHEGETYLAQARRILDEITRHVPLGAQHDAMARQRPVDGDLAVVGAQVAMQLDGLHPLARYLRSGRLRQVLEGWQAPAADLYAVVPARHQGTLRVRAFVEHLAQAFGRRAGGA
jgi:DNA-binding transcriptional LysR family regulator